MFTALGIPATLISNSDRLLPNIDGELARLVADEFQRRGVRLILGAGADKVKRVDGRLNVTLSTGTVLAGDAVLFAAGRTPNTEGLGLEQAGVRLENGRIVVDHYYRTTAPGIYAAGDVVKPGLASNAMQQGRAAAAHACGLVLGIEIDETASSAVYGLPEVASVGATKEQIQATAVPYAVGRCDLATTPRGAIAGHGGLLKLIFRADNRKLLGVHCFGDIASEVVGLGAFRGAFVDGPGGRLAAARAAEAEAHELAELTGIPVGHPPTGAHTLLTLALRGREARARATAAAVARDPRGRGAASEAAMAA